MLGIIDTISIAREDVLHLKDFYNDDFPSTINQT